LVAEAERGMRAEQVRDVHRMTRMYVSRCESGD
jgi:hypothetical protein